MNPGSRITLWLFILWCCLGCGHDSPEPYRPTRKTITYTFDAHTKELINNLTKKAQIPAYADFDRYFKGLMVPESLLPFEPFVLGLSTESRIPTVLMLDAPWVQRYGMAGWLYELENTGVFAREELVPAVAEAFSVSLKPITGRPQKELVAVPTSIKGNILFYRIDILERYKLTPPKTWDELKAICQKVLPKERSFKYGLIFHMTNFANDFFPIFWGYGGQVINEEGQLILHQPKNAAAWTAALKDLISMQGTIVPIPKELKELEVPEDTRQVFFRGEALFMINWNTRLRDLWLMTKKETKKNPGGVTEMKQVGVVPIPCQSGHPRRYSNIGSFGWGVNRYAVTSPEVIKGAKEFINLVADETFQLEAAETLGMVPALRSALEKVKNPGVIKAYQNTFGRPDVVLQPRPYNRRINNVLEKFLQEALYGRQSPEAALQAALAELKDLAAPE